MTNGIIEMSALEIFSLSKKLCVLIGRKFEH